MPRVDISQNCQEQIEIFIHQVHRNIQNIMNDTINNDCLCDIYRQLRKAHNRSCEFQNRSFIVLVVGPVKSGKSTLVNIVSNTYVSPTHFLECTVRPSIITHHATERRITTYISTEIKDRADQFDSIIDCLRGLDSYENIPNININGDGNGLPLTKENIDAQVALDLAQIKNDNTLTTTITTSGGTLLQDDVFLVDMPGIDGKYVNIDNPIYTTIAQRADLIIFVQSSNSAVNMASNDFLNILYKKNPSVQVCLIHNVFDAAHWRTDDSKFEAAEKQKKFAISEIRGKGFIVDEDNCFSVNLGKVDDAQKKEFHNNEFLQTELTKFRTIEQQLYNRIIVDRDRIRTGNCYNRTWDQIERLEELVSNKLMEMNHQLEKYETIANLFDAIDISNQIKMDDDTIESLITLSMVTSAIEMEGEEYILKLPNSEKVRTTIARGWAAEFLLECEKVIKNIACGIDMVKQIEGLYKVKFTELKNMINVILTNNGVAAGDINIMNIKVNNITYEALNLYTLLNVEQIIPRLSGTKKHNVSTIKNYFSSKESGKIIKLLDGGISPTGVVTRGIIEKQVMPIVKNAIKLSVTNYQNQIIESCKSYLEEKRKETLGLIVNDIDKFTTCINELTTIDKNIKKI